VLLPACEAALPAPVLELLTDFFLGQHDVLERIITNANTHDFTLERIARNASEALCERMAVNEARLLKAPKIIIGRAPSCDVIVDGPAVSREHCVLEWVESGFVARDTSAAGTYVDDKRIVQQSLAPSSVLRVVDTLFRLGVRGEVCTLERMDALLAQAAVDVARQHASMMTRSTYGML